MKKWLYIVGGTILFAGGVVGTLVLYPKAAQADFDLPGLNQRVQRHEERLDNHEARITNLEQDAQVLQAATHTAPAPNPQPVPPVVTPAPVENPPAAEPAPAQPASPSPSENSHSTTTVNPITP